MKIGFPVKAHTISGIPPNAPDDFADYTVPMLKFADGSYMMDSLPIVQRLETLYPEPSLPMNLDLLKRMGSTQAKALGPLSAVIIPRVRRNVLCEPSEAWFKQDRERRFGMPEEQYEREHGGEGAWKSAKDGQQLLASFLKEQKQDEGPFILGSTVCYVDFVLVGRLEFADAVGDEVYERFVSGVDGLRELHQACKPWFERSDH